MMISMTKLYGWNAKRPLWLFVVAASICLSGCGQPVVYPKYSCIEPNESIVLVYSLNDEPEQELPLSTSTDIGELSYAENQVFRVQRVKFDIPGQPRLNSLRVRIDLMEYVPYSVPQSWSPVGLGQPITPIQGRNEAPGPNESWVLTESHNTLYVSLVTEDSGTLTGKVFKPECTATVACLGDGESLAAWNIQRNMFAWVFTNYGIWKTLLISLVVFAVTRFFFWLGVRTTDGTLKQKLTHLINRTNQRYDQAKDTYDAVARELGLQLEGPTSDQQEVAASMPMLDDVEHVYIKILEHIEAEGSQFNIAATNAQLGLLYLLRGDLTQAHHRFTIALSGFEDIIKQNSSTRTGIGLCYFSLGKIALQKGDLEQAKSLLTTSSQIDSDIRLYERSAAAQTLLKNC